MKRSAIILAAGAGTRLGGPKARLLVDGVPLALAHVRRAREAGCERVVVVTRCADQAWIAGASEVTGEVTAVVSEEPDQAGSLGVGVRALFAEGDGDGEDAHHDGWVLVTPVDVLPARVETIQRLATAFRPGISAVNPMLRGTGGHPVLVRASVLAAYDGAPLRDVLEALGAARLRLEVDDSNVVTDLDTPADVIAATGAPPLFVAGPL